MVVLINSRVLQTISVLIVVCFSCIVQSAFADRLVEGSRPGKIVGWGEQVVGIDLASSFTAIAGGSHHSLGLKEDGSIVTWGFNWAVQCDVPKPNIGFVAIAAGASHSMGLKEDGSIVAWGDNWDGECDVPQPNTGFVAIAAGDTYSLAIRNTSGKYSGGTGEPNDPYQIATAADLMALGETPEDYDKHFIMTSDIDLDPNLPGRKVFDRAVIGIDSFKGHFDGGSHIISHLAIRGVGNLGLFGQTDAGAIISNLGLEAVDVNGIGGCVAGLVGQNYGSITSSYSTGTVTGSGKYVGGLVGENRGGTIAQSHSSGEVSGSGYNVGGLVGWSIKGGRITQSYSSSTVSGDISVGGLVGTNTGTIVTSYSAGAVSGNSQVGGLVGINRNGDVNHCYSSGEVRGGNRGSIGGLVGVNWDGNVTHCYSTGLVSGKVGVGGLIGNGMDSEVIESFWDLDISGQATSDGGTGKTTAEMQTVTTFLDAGWDFVDETVNGTDDVWKIVEGQTYPLLFWQKYGGGTGEPNAPYLIYTAEHLNELGAEPNDYDRHFKLMADIDLSDYVYDRAVIAPDVNDVEDRFQGIPFTGTFDGSGHAISHLTIDGGSYLGLFGNLVNFSTIITNVRLESVSVSGTGDCVGNLVGQNYAKIVSCHSSGTIVGKRDVGGLVGRNYFAGSRILESSSKCTVMGDMSVGGLVGFMSSGRVKQCFSTGAVTGKTLVGGLVGLNGGDSISSGGFGGNPYVEDSYSACTVTGEGDAYGYGGEEVGIGGLVGFSGGYVYDSYSTGFVSGSGINVGGLVGRTGEWSGFVERSFWDTQTSAQVSCGWWVLGCIGKTTAEMQTASTFLAAGWDFVDETANGTEEIWWIDEGTDYPRLWWELE